MYAQSTEEQQAQFCKLLHDALVELGAQPKSVPPSAVVVGHLLADLHCIEDIEVNPWVLAGVWSGWRQRLRYASETFSEEELRALLKAKAAAYGRFPREQQGTHVIIKVPLDGTRLSNELTAIDGLVQLVRYERLKKHLVEGHNPEINTDREAVVSRLAALGFPKDVEEALRDVDAKLQVADSPFDFKGCIDLVRAVFEKVVQHSAAAVSKRSAQTLASGPAVGNFSPYKQYLQNNGLLTPNEAEAVQKLYNYLSTDGAHALGSAPEQARVAKNNVIEWSLLILGRVQKYLGNKA